MQPESFCFLPLHKPAGPTSHDMVDLVRKLVPRKLKVGHTGTLDPFASGVLIMALGKATRFADEVHLLPKSYISTLRLGTRTNTLDPTGEMSEEQPIPEFSDNDLKGLAKRFTGTQMQVPPVFSAKKVGGRKSYELARENKAVELEPKEVTIHDLQITRKSDKNLRIALTCSTGTYVRALGRDLAEALGTCGYLVDLERSAVGPITTEQCVPSEQLTKGLLASHAIQVSSLLTRFPEILLPPEALPQLLQGRPFRISERAPSSFLGTFRDDSGAISAVFKCAYDPALSAIQSKMMCYLKDN